MAHLVNLSYGGVSIDLTVSANFGTYIDQIDPRTIDPETLTGELNLRVLFSGASSMTSVSGIKESIDRAFDFARWRQERQNGDRVYVNFTGHGAGVTLRAEVFGGSCDVLSGAIHEAAQGYIPATLTIQHGVWEGPRTGISISNVNGSGTSPLAIVNHRSGASINAGMIGSSEISGSIKAPLEVQITNITGSKVLNNIHLCNDVKPGAGVFLQGESGTATGGSTTAGAQYSGGNALSFTVNTTNQITWSLSAATLALLAGRNFRLIGKFEFSGTLYVKCWLQTGGGVIVTPVTKEVTFATQTALQVLGPIPMPPGGLTATDWSSLTLVVAFRSAASVSAKCDFVQLTASDQRAYRKLLFNPLASTTLGINDQIIDDGTEGFTYAKIASYKTPVLIARGEPLYVIPKVQQEIQFLFDGPSYDITWPFNIQLFYRPRYRLLA